MILQAKQKMAAVIGKAEGEIEELQETINILRENPEMGNQIYLIENFNTLIRPFAETLNFFPSDKISVITGVDGKHEPISAIHPNAIDEMKNNLIGGVMGDIFSKKKDVENNPPSN